MKWQTPIGVPGHQFYNNIIYLYNYIQLFPLHTTMVIINDNYFVFSSCLFLLSLRKHKNEGLE